MELYIKEKTHFLTVFGDRIRRVCLRNSRWGL